RLPRVAIVQEEGTTGTALCSAAVSLLALPSLAMADEVGPVTIGAVQDLDNHEATRSRWGYSASETLMENNTSTPVRHLRPADRPPGSGLPAPAVWSKGCSGHNGVCWADNSRQTWHRPA